ncbi:bacterial bifunctional deaminase-reductase [Exidia glandulosa HHB12029]|uniref:2,5-diamino-6-ribosylamino-4(3H)-pyrimidinone 5'-phosphate reductase n=1 Tax=Exidia glandulosa HHB12029 TaxID=1314781 RepID=A0A165KC89_EXIGL|nr:bacterial bifunctional deaminase-reductase [Exidia glandulosa HHB12029]
MSAPGFLHSVLTQPLQPSQCARRPWVTLTYAQSLDARIAGAGGKQLILSGKESMLMTHWMRTMHDGILVGIGTALNDNPQLNTRHVPNNTSLPAPRPIILDPYLRLPPTCKLLTNYAARTGRRPWIFCSPSAPPAQRTLLEKAGAVLFDIPTVLNGNGLDIQAMLDVLHEKGIKSLMVEGGQRVISSFYAARDTEGRPIVDALIVTVAPTLVGAAGVGVALDGAEKTLTLKHLRTEIMGKDTVVACQVVADA